MSRPSLAAAVLYADPPTAFPPSPRRASLPSSDRGGLSPRVTEEIVKLMTAALGGRDAMRLKLLAGAVAGLGLLGAAGAALAADHLGVACATPPPQHCSGADCASALIIEQGTAVDPKTGRKFFLDYPCDLKPN